MKITKGVPESQEHSKEIIRKQYKSFLTQFGEVGMPAFGLRYAHSIMQNKLGGEDSIRGGWISTLLWA